MDDTSDSHNSIPNQLDKNSTKYHDISEKSSCDQSAEKSNNHCNSQPTTAISLISKCSQRALKCDSDIPWTCPSTNSQSSRHNNQSLRKREDKHDLFSDLYSFDNDYDEDTLEIPPEYARDDIEIVVDLYIWFEKVRSFLLGLLC